MPIFPRYKSRLILLQISCAHGIGHADGHKPSHCYRIGLADQLCNSSPTAYEYPLGKTFMKTLETVMCKPLHQPRAPKQDKASCGARDDLFLFYS